jgi:hypothetical protein
VHGSFDCTGDYDNNNKYKVETDRQVATMQEFLVWTPSVEAPFLENTVADYPTLVQAKQW